MPATSLAIPPKILFAAEAADAAACCVFCVPSRAVEAAAPALDAARACPLAISACIPASPDAAEAALCARLVATTEADA